jgi:deoxyhypusine synthase
MLALILAGMCSGLAFADGATNARERFFLKRQSCAWTDEMGKYIFECIKKNDGFNAHWCHNEAIDIYCPKTDDSSAADAMAAAKAKATEKEEAPR